MTYRMIKFLVVLCALGGCSGVRSEVEGDVATAVTIAADAGDTAGAACFKALEPVVRMAPAGLLSDFEIARASRIIVEDGPCVSLAAGLFLHLLDKIPGTLE